MKLSVTCVYGSKEKKFNVPVGDGTCTFKWLGLAASTRFTTSPHGSLRNREQTNAPKPHNTQLMPNTIYTDESVFYHPDALLKDHLKDRQEVTIELIEKVSVNDRGTPQLAKWAFIAFNVSEQQSEARERALKEQMDEIEEARKAAEEDELQRRLQEARKKINELRVVMKPQFHNEADVVDQMKDEWNRMTTGNVLENIVPDYQMQNKIRKFFTTNLFALGDMFKHAAAIGADAGVCTMSFMEFNNFMKECEALKNMQTDHVQKLFTSSKITDEDSNNEFHQHDFFISLVNVAVHKYITSGRGRSNSVAAARGGKRAAKLNPVEALTKLFEDHLRPYIEANLAGTSIKSAIASDEVLLIFKEKEEELSKVFSIYGDRFADTSEVQSGENSMNIQEFGNCIKDAKLLERTTAKTNDELTLKEVRQAFSGSQHDSAVGEEEKKAVAEGTRSSHQKQMIYPEFLEAIARIGTAKWDDGTLVYRIERAINAVAAIVR